MELLKDADVELSEIIRKHRDSVIEQAAEEMCRSSSFQHIKQEEKKQNDKHVSAVINGLSDGKEADMSEAKVEG